MLERAHKRLGRQVVSQISRCTAPQVTAHRVEMSLEDRNERQRIRPRRTQRLAIAQLSHSIGHCRPALAGSRSSRRDASRGDLLRDWPLPLRSEERGFHVALLLALDVVGPRLVKGPDELQPYL